MPSRFLGSLVSLALATVLASAASAVTVVSPVTTVAPPNTPQTQPSVAALADETFVVVFEDGSLDIGIIDPPLPIDGRDGSIEGIVGQRVDAQGRRVGDWFLANASTEGRQICPKVAPDPATGGFVVAWIDVENGSATTLRRFDAEARATSGEIVVAPGPTLHCGVGLATLPDGTAIVTTRSVDGLAAHRVSPAGAVVETDSTAVPLAPGFLASDLRPLADGGAVLMTRASLGSVRLARLDADGRFAEADHESTLAFSGDLAIRPATEIAERVVVATSRDRRVDLRFHAADAVADPPIAVAEGLDTTSWVAVDVLDDPEPTFGRILLVTAATGDPPSDPGGRPGRLVIQRLDTEFLLPAFRVGDAVRLDVGFDHRFAAPIDVAVSGGGRALVAWMRDFSGPIDMVVVDTAETPTLTLADDRFEVQARWRDFLGQEGMGVPVPLSEDTGAFWFFDPANLELTVKVLDGRAINGHFWVFNGSLSNVEYTLEVRDTVTGAVYTVANPLGNFGSFGDTEALPGG